MGGELQRGSGGRRPPEIFRVLDDVRMASYTSKVVFSFFLTEKIKVKFVPCRRDLHSF